MAGRFPGDSIGTIAAVAVGFARYLGVLLPSISPNVWIVHPIRPRFEVRDQPFDTQQLGLGVLMIVFLTFINTLGVRLGEAYPKCLHQREDACHFWG